LNQFSRNILIWGIISLMVVVVFNVFNRPPISPQEKMAYSEFLSQAEADNVREVLIQGNSISGKMADGRSFQTYAPYDPRLVETLMRNGKVTVRAEPPEDAPWYMSLLVSWPMLLLIGVWIFFMRQMQGGAGRAMSFGRSRARMLHQDQGRVTFADVAGVDEAKEELTEIVDFLSNPKKFTRLGGRIPKGVLLVGSPGTGKTLLARAVAGEAGVPFFSISGSDFVEMFVGVGASRVRDLFVQGKKNAPCLIFIDEIDAVGRQRGAGLGGGHDEREQTLNQLLVEMDGFESNEGVILIAATNRPDVLDPALLRPGRFDRQVIVPTPDLKGRKHILEVHTKRTPLSGDVNLDVIAKSTPGFSGASLENLVNEAALQAAKQSKNVVAMEDFEYAKDKVIMGKERRSLIMTDEEKRVTAYHEAGHALVAKLLPHADPVHKVTIIPRGRALGVTMMLPEGDHLSTTLDQALTKLRVWMAGRVAEELLFPSISSGAAGDIQQSTRYARAMVCSWGMSTAIGPVAVGDPNDEVFIGREWGMSRTFSEDTARLVDEEIRRFIEDARKDAYALLEKHLDVLHAIAGDLLERETITGEDIDAFLTGGKPSAGTPAPPPSAADELTFTLDDGKGPDEKEAFGPDQGADSKPSAPKPSAPKKSFLKRPGKKNPVPTEPAHQEPGKDLPERDPSEKDPGDPDR
jgi:cell division protease FtsH